MTLGLGAAGIAPEHLFERNPRACATLRQNKRVAGALVGNVNEQDVRDVAWSSVPRPVRLLAAGPPCQPFSLAGKHRADSDPRNEFPATLRAIRALAPAVVALENVQGLARESFRPYFDYLLRQLAFPSVAPVSPDEKWVDHDARLRLHAEATPEAEYQIRWGVLNAADFGVPQMRTRVVILATRAGLPVVELPEPTHSRNALIHAQTTGAYWRLHGIERPADFTTPKRGPAQHEDPDAVLKPWRTVRDALSGLRAPSDDENDDLQHWVVPGARLYRGHRGSLLDWPSKTIKAGVHGVAGGENIVHLDDGTYRYFTLREMARMQGFPDTYKFFGPRSRIIGQIGNAVPCGLAEAIGRRVLQMCETVPGMAQDQAKLRR
ncbi:MAG: DNA cytosine methyltransferase [Alphaproteobacteria bacterium]|nr:DNA cytosine methyltransferase [Alphaproteobacteria bacterium]